MGNAWKFSNFLLWALLTSDDKKELSRRLKNVKLPYDIGRLSSNIFDNDGLKGAAAEQWKTYITVCARPCMYKLLPRRPYKCLLLLSEIVVKINQLQC